MAHMKPQYLDGKFYSVEVNHETTVIPFESFDIKEYIPKKVGDEVTIELIEGVGARLSAPGYLDCTPWDVYENIQEARRDIIDCWYVCPDCGEQLEDTGWESLKCSHCDWDESKDKNLA